MFRYDKNEGTGLEEIKAAHYWVKLCNDTNQRNKPREIQDDEFACPNNCKYNHFHPEESGYISDFDNGKFNSPTYRNCKRCLLVGPLQMMCVVCGKNWQHVIMCTDNVEERFLPNYKYTTTVYNAE